ncbi:hypothetical protein TcWFU_010549 [Taenia crassiceps]|uniref:Uncharacterized protein n=1 Tax=Taenia crassiceps TaxID=6207 RepID=A0ABR4Q407_9CEST
MTGGHLVVIIVFTTLSSPPMEGNRMRGRCKRKLSLMAHNVEVETEAEAAIGSITSIRANWYFQRSPLTNLSCVRSVHRLFHPFKGFYNSPGGSVPLGSFNWSLFGSQAEGCAYPTNRSFDARIAEKALTSLQWETTPRVPSNLRYGRRMPG